MTTPEELRVDKELERALKAAKVLLGPTNEGPTYPGVVEIPAGLDDLTDAQG